jgi:tryptophan synthase alpha chain
MTAGFPDPVRSLDVLRAIADAGADVIEVGIPFSDPMADGPIIQQASQRALEHGVGFRETLRLIERARLSVPVVLFSYLNPLLAAGPGALESAASAGVHGVLVTDLPVGADPVREAWFGSGPLDFIRLISVTTPIERMQAVTEHGRGFVYLISRTGVTGVQQRTSMEFPGAMQRARQATTLPICAGFGVSTAEHVREIAALADGVVVGSALVRAAEQSTMAASALISEFRRTLDELAA